MSLATSLVSKFSRNLVLTTGLIFGTAAHADVISYSDLTAGSHSNTVNGTTVSAWNDQAQTQSAVFGGRTQAGVAGMGIQGHGNNEIDFYYNADGSEDSETMAFDFSNDVVISELTLSLLFNGPEYSNEHEIAQISIDGHIGRLELVPSQEDTAKWYVDGVFIKDVSSCSPGATARGGSGCFSILNPFGNLATSNLDLAAAKIPNVDESDYLFRSVSFANVPEPSTLALLMIGAAGLVASRKFQKKA